MKNMIRRSFIVLTGLIILAASAGLAMAMHNGASKLPIKQYFSKSYTNAVWDWSNPVSKSNKELTDTASFLYLHQINQVYVDVSAYSATDKSNTNKKALDSALSRYVTAMKKRNISVSAAAGDVNWSKLENRSIPKQILKSVQNYNQAHPNAKLKGMEFDIESYNQDSFADSSPTEKGLVLTDFLDTVDQLKKANLAYIKTTSAQLELGFAVPYWFDNENGNIPVVTWHNKTGPTLYHLLDTLNELPQSNIVVMSYRNAANGNDGVIFHSRTEIDYAAAKAQRVKVIIGQEVGQVDPAKITYYGKSATEFASQVSLVEQSFAPTKVYGGIAINDLASFRLLDKNE